MLTDIKILIITPVEHPTRSLTYEDVVKFEDCGNKLVFTGKFETIRVFYTAYIRSYILLPKSLNEFESNAKDESK